MNDFIRHREQIERDIADIVQCLQMLGHFFHTTTFNPIIGTDIVAPVIRVRDSLILNCVSSMYRILDKWNPGSDRVCFDRLIGEMKASSITIDYDDFKNRIDFLRSSDEWLYCLEIRHGRFAHSLDNRGNPVIYWEKLSKVREDIISLMDIINPGFGKQCRSLTGNWNKLSTFFWERVIEE